MPKNYCNQTLIVKVIVENVVTCFYGTRCTFGKDDITTNSYTQIVLYTV